MAEVVIRSEVITEGELETVPEAQLRATLRLLAQDPTRGKPLARSLRGCRSIRIVGAENRLVYRIAGDQVVVLAIGRRRESAVYNVAERRVT